MNPTVSKFCNLVRDRSRENTEAMRMLDHRPGIVGPKIAILRQELDSMVRAIFLLSRPDPDERISLMEDTLQGRQWRVQTPNGKKPKVTDRMMVDLAQTLNGWTQAVYKFGCAFIHLSNFHGHGTEDPFQRLSKADRESVLHYLRHYLRLSHTDHLLAA